MNLSDAQIQSLLKMLALTKNQETTCDECLRHLAEFVETTLPGKTIPEGLLCIDEHLQHCGECREEFETLKLALDDETFLA